MRNLEAPETRRVSGAWSLFQIIFNKFPIKQRLTCLISHDQIINSIRIGRNVYSMFWVIGSNVKYIYLIINRIRWNCCWWKHQQRRTPNLPPNIPYFKQIYKNPLTLYLTFTHRSSPNALPLCISFQIYVPTGRSEKSKVCWPCPNCS